MRENHMLKRCQHQRPETVPHHELSRLCQWLLAVLHGWHTDWAQCLIILHSASFNANGKWNPKCTKTANLAALQPSGCCRPTPATSVPPATAPSSAARGPGWPPGRRPRRRRHGDAREQCLRSQTSPVISLVGGCSPGVDHICKVLMNLVHRLYRGC